MKFLFVTLFPEQIEQAAGHSILQRAASKGLIEVSCINPRDFTHDVHRTVDDSPFGGGAGMVLKPEPMVAAIRKAKEQLPNAVLLRCAREDARSNRASLRNMLTAGRILSSSAVIMRL